MGDKLFGTVQEVVFDGEALKKAQGQNDIGVLHGMIEDKLKSIEGLQERIKYINEYKANYEAHSRTSFIPEDRMIEYVGLRDDLRRSLAKLEESFANFCKVSGVDIEGFEDLARLVNNYALKSREIQSNAQGFKGEDVDEYRRACVKSGKEEEEIIAEIISLASNMFAKTKGVLDGKPKESIEVPSETENLEGLIPKK